MGKIEIDVKKRARKENIQKIILGSLAAAGLMGLALGAPNALQALRPLGLIPKGKNSKRTLGNLIEQDLVQFKTRNGKKFLAITEKGKRKLMYLELNNFSFKRPRKWDKKWRIIIFDIQENRRGLRDKLRLQLKNIGFTRLQQSVWVYPYDCEDILMLLKADMELGKGLLYIVADRIENDKKLREGYSLPKE